MLERVLIVDEDVKVRGFLYELFTEVGLNALTLPAASEALEFLKKERPVLVIIGYTPGEYSCLSLAKKIRVLDKDVKIIVLGCSKIKECDVAEIEEAGITASLDKNFENPQVIKTILSIVKQEVGIKPVPEKRWGRVLIVDDEQDTREMVVNFLQRKGFETDAASSGEECVEKVKAFDFDAVVLDITMGGMDGLLTLKLIKEAKPQVKVIMATALQSKDLVKQALVIGASDYITKPFNLAILESTLLSFLVVDKIAKKSP